MITWYRDLARTMDYLETRADIDQDRIAYFGVSWGASLGPIILALEPRFRAAVLCWGGFYSRKFLPETDAFQFAPRVKLPLVMTNGRGDNIFPVETSQDPMYRWLGTPAARKRRVLVEGGHSIPKTTVAKETLDWLDTYLGPVR